jgi:hypothetical protein
MGQRLRTRVYDPGSRDYGLGFRINGFGGFRVRG